MDQQFRLCGLAYDGWLGHIHNPSIFKIRVSNNLRTDPYWPVSYSSVAYVTPALSCIMVDDTGRHPDTEFYAVPNVRDDHSVYVAELREAELEDGSEFKALEVTDLLTQVSSLYRNTEQFQERGYFVLLQNAIRSLLRL